MKRAKDSLKGWRVKTRKGLAPFDHKMCTPNLASPSGPDASLTERSSAAAPSLFLAL